MLSAALPLLLAGLANAHLVAWSKGMYCLNGTVPGVDNVNNDAPVPPLYDMSYNDYWLHGVNGCTKFPPAEGDFLELPAGKSITVEIADNRAATTLSFNGAKTTEWGDGKNHPEGYSITNLGGAPLSSDGCLSEPNMHTQNESMAAGTAFAIAYVSDISQANPSNMAIFTVAYNTPYKRLATYDIPADLPACPEGGCICAWTWIPNGCGQFNQFMAGYKCKVTGATSTTPVAKPKPAVWCQDDQSSCTQGAKQIMIWNQQEGNTVQVSGVDDAGQRRHPGYNMKMGFKNGAQNDIFEGAPSSGSGINTGSSSSYVAPPHSSSSAKHSSTAAKVVATSYAAPPPGSSAAPSASISSSHSTSTCSTKSKRNAHKRMHDHEFF